MGYTAWQAGLVMAPRGDGRDDRDAVHGTDRARRGIDTKRLIGLASS